MLKQIRAPFADDEDDHEPLEREDQSIEESSVSGNLIRQNEEFCRRMIMAIETGEEICPMTVCREPGTSRPIANYSRRD
jgi:hypothetical protein